MISVNKQGHHNNIYNNKNNDNNINNNNNNNNINNNSRPILLTITKPNMISYNNNKNKTKNQFNLNLVGSLDQCWSTYSNLETARARPLELYEFCRLELRLCFGSLIWWIEAEARIWLGAFQG